MTQNIKNPPPEASGSGLSKIERAGQRAPAFNSAEPADGQAKSAGNAGLSSKKHASTTHENAEYSRDAAGQGRDAEFARVMALLDAGMAILPLSGKAPCRVLAPRGVYSAVTDRERIAGWMQRGLNLGATSPDGRIFHLDIDPRNGGDAQSLRLAVTWAYWTGRGDNGAHILYRVPQGVTLGSASLGPGIDVLGPGKYGVIPPSIHPGTGQPYRWVEGRSPLDCALAEVPPHIIERLSFESGAPQGEEREDVCLDEVISALPYIDAAPDDLWWRVGMALKRALGDDLGWALFNAWSRRAANYDEPRNRKRWRSFGRRLRDKPVTLATIFFLARKNGWRGWMPPDSPDYPDEMVARYIALHEQEGGR